MARPPLGGELVESLPGSAAAKQKLRLILQTLGKTTSIPEAMAELGISEGMFHRLRHDFLEKAIGLLEPKPLGRPKNEAFVDAQEVAELRRQLRDERVEKEAAFLRAELAMLMPGVLRPEAKKKRR